MANKHGEWIWFELWSSDPDAAQAFYGDLLGWSAADSGSPDMDYRLLSTTNGEIAGLMSLPEEARADGPAWLGYVGVDNVDDSAKAIEDAGGAIHMPPTTLAGIGRMSMVADPQGITFYVMRGESAESSTAFRQCRQFADTQSLGHAVWCELSSPDPDAAIDFYGRVFGWRKEGGMPMGELGEYGFWQAGDVGFGAVMGLVAEGRKGWLFYFHVADIDQAARKIRDAGGTILQEPMEVPGGAYSLAALDPQGAAFGLVGLRKS